MLKIQFIILVFPHMWRNTFILLFLTSQRKNNHNFNAMQQLSLFRGVHDTQPRPVTLEELVTMMRTDQSVRDLTEKHRHARAMGDERNASRYKKMMASFGVAARFEGGRQLKHIVELTGLSLVDIDHIGKENIPSVLEKVRGDEHTLLAYTTISGEGVRIIARFALNENDDDNRYPLRTMCSLAGPPSHRALWSPRSARLGIQPTLQGPRYAP